jgi:hypothetical protein
MATVRDLIASAMRDLGALGVSEVPTDDEAQDALIVLNDMIGTWKTEKLMSFSMSQVELSYPVLKAQYTIGPGGDFDVARPMRIESAYNRQYTDTTPNDYEIYVTNNYEDYANIITKGTNSTLVTCLYYDATYPLGNIYLWPIPSDSSYKLVLWTWGIIDEFSSINDVITLSPGSSRALRSNLAIELSARYGREVVPSLARIANDSKAQLKRYNLSVKALGFDRALTGGAFSFNYLTGQPS